MNRAAGRLLLVFALFGCNQHEPLAVEDLPAAQAAA